MKKVLLVGVGLVLLLAGVIFTLQGSGSMGGSAMSGVAFWAIAGPVIALVGLTLVFLGLRSGRAGPRARTGRTRLLSRCRLSRQGGVLKPWISTTSGHSPPTKTRVPQYLASTPHALPPALVTWLETVLEPYPRANS